MLTFGRFPLLMAMSLQVVFGQGIPPDRWTLDTAESKEFPRGFGVAIEKYLPEYRTADAKIAAKALLDTYKSSDLGPSIQLWSLSSDILLPLGDGLLGATAEYGNMLVQMNRARYASDEVYDSYKRRLFKAKAVIKAATIAIGRQCDGRMLGLLRRLHFTDEIGRDLQESIDEAIAKLGSASCR